MIRNVNNTTIAPSGRALPLWRTSKAGGHTFAEHTWLPDHTVSLDMSLARKADGVFFDNMKRIFLILAFLTIVFITTAVYFNSFSVPFQFDDVKRIVDIKAAQVLDPGEIFKYSKNRFLLYLSFAFNFYLGQQDVFGYHLLNLLVHIISSCLVFLLCLSVFNSPKFTYPGLKKDKGLLALFSALIFAVHPIQTQAVTYIYQRGESMAAMFSLLALFLYARFRMIELHSPTKKGRWILYAACLVSIALSGLTKATAAALPAGRS